MVGQSNKLLHNVVVVVVIALLSFRNFETSPQGSDMSECGAGAILPLLSLRALPIMDVSGRSKLPACLCGNNPHALLGASLSGFLPVLPLDPVGQSRGRCSSWLRTLWRSDGPQTWCCGTMSAVRTSAVRPGVGQVWPTRALYLQMWVQICVWSLRVIFPPPSHDRVQRNATLGTWTNQCSPNVTEDSQPAGCGKGIDRVFAPSHKWDQLTYFKLHGSTLNNYWTTWNCHFTFFWSFKYHSTKRCQWSVTFYIHPTCDFYLLRTLWNMSEGTNLHS